MIEIPLLLDCEYEKAIGYIKISKDFKYGPKLHKFSPIYQLNDQGKPELLALGIVNEPNNKRQ
jgi:hypothetical protein